MSYCRFSDDSDVYMFEHVDGFVSCCSCKLRGELPSPWWREPARRVRVWLLSWVDLLETLAKLGTLTLWMPHKPWRWMMWTSRYAQPMEPDPELPTFADALSHLELHVAAGHKVPPRAVKRLKEEIASKRSPTDPPEPCAHGVPWDTLCGACQREWELSNVDDAGRFRDAVSR